MGAASRIASPFGVVACTTLAGLWCYALLGLLQAQTTDVHERKPRFTYDLSQDPPIGLLMDLPAVDARGRQMPLTKGYYWVAVFGSCTECSAKSLLRDRLPATIRSPIVCVFPDSKETLQREFQKVKDERVLLISDVSGALARRLNSLWSPRLYWVTNGKVAAIQRTPDDAIWQRHGAD